MYIGDLGIWFSGQEPVEIIRRCSILQLVDAGPSENPQARKHRRAPVGDVKPCIAFPLAGRLGKGRERHEAAVLRLQPPAPVGRAGVADIVDLAIDT